jgi:succinoglycan biosynthesis protein ExoM
MSRSTRHLTIVVAALTRKRPEMLRALLRSWSLMRHPENCTINFLVVENDIAKTSLPVVEAACASFEGSSLRYVQELELGIPFARNRAVREAIAEKADILMFVDDDEEVAADWMICMIAAYRSSDAVLLGGPLRSLPPSKLTFMQRKMYENVDAFYRRKEQAALELTANNRGSKVRVATNNWLADLSIFTSHNIWFDEKMRFTGGTDSKLFASVRDAGLETSWVPDAIVYETIPVERLSFRYQYRRSRDQSNNHARHKTQSNRRPVIFSIAPVPKKLGVLMMQIIALPFTRGRNLLDIARTLGWISGRVGFVFGRRPSLYTAITGN